MKKIKIGQYGKYAASYYLGGCSVLLGFYATWFHYYGFSVHTQSVLNIVLWPYYLVIMLASWML